MNDVSVILPVYNESGCIQASFDAVLEFTSKHPSFEFIFVNDGSTDTTQEVLGQRILETETSKISLLTYPFHQGKGWAVKQGVELAQGDYICFLDSDLAYSLDHLERLVEGLHYFDIAIGCRSFTASNFKDTSLPRWIAGRAFNFISQKVLDLPLSDMQAGLKGFRKKVAKELFSIQKLTGYSFDAELLYLAKKKGYSIIEIPALISKQHRLKTSKVSILVDSTRMLIDLISIRIYHNFKFFK